MHVAPLSRADFPAETLAALARGRRLLLDGQGLVAPARIGPLELDADYDPDVLRQSRSSSSPRTRRSCSSTATTSARWAASASREVVVTLGSRGCIVFADGVAELVRAHPVAARRPDRRRRRVRGRLPRRPQRRRGADRCGTPGGRARLRPPRRPRGVIAHVRTADGVAVVDLDDESLVALDPAAPFEPPAQPACRCPLVVAAAAAGSTVVAVVDTKPPLVVSHDAGLTWRESGRGLPPGRAVAISAEDPDVVLYATRNRLYLSRDGGRFWRGLASSCRRSRPSRSSRVSIARPVLLVLRAGTRRARRRRPSRRPRPARLAPRCPRPARTASTGGRSRRPA